MNTFRLLCFRVPVLNVLFNGPVLNVSQILVTRGKTTATLLHSHNRKFTVFLIMRESVVELISMDHLIS
jgi:hypothetical protein